jgi:HEXXH motif-containing protein
MMSLQAQPKTISAEAPKWDLAPSVARVDGIDEALRRRLAKSLNYLGEVASLDASQKAALARIEDRLKAGPVSPWVFGLYSKLVAELSKNTEADVSKIFDDIERAAALPAHQGAVAFGDPGTPESWWHHFSLLFDTDRQRPFKPKTPSAEDCSLSKQDVEESLAVLKRGEPAWHDEVRSLVRMIVLGAPKTSDAADLFNGASTFFLWGASLLNGNLRRSNISMVDLLVHESSHLLLFGVSAEGALTTNSGHERYASPVRKDKRPIDGIFHACFVSTRVHLAMQRLIETGCLSDNESELAVHRRRFNGDSARAALDMLELHAKPTEQGEKILNTLRAYWAGVELD